MNQWARDWWDANRGHGQPEKTASVSPQSDDATYTPDPKMARRHKRKGFSKRNIHGDSTICPKTGRYLG